MQEDSNTLNSGRKETDEVLRYCICEGRRHGETNKKLIPEISLKLFQDCLTKPLFFNKKKKVNNISVVSYSLFNIKNKDNIFLNNFHMEN